MPGRITENQTMSRVRLMIETRSPGTLDASRGRIQVIDEEVDVEQRGIVGPPRSRVVSDSHELQTRSFTAHGRPFHVVHERDLAPGDIGVEGRQSRRIWTRQRD